MFTLLTPGVSPSLNEYQCVGTSISVLNLSPKKEDQKRWYPTSERVVRVRRLIRGPLRPRTKLTTVIPFNIFSPCLDERREEGIHLSEQIKISVKGRSLERIQYTEHSSLSYFKESMSPLSPPVSVQYLDSGEHRVQNRSLVVWLRVKYVVEEVPRKGLKVLTQRVGEEWNRK